MKGQHLPLVLGNGIQLFRQFFLQSRIPGNAQQGGTGTAEAEGSAGGAHQGFNLIIVRNQFSAVLLVKPVLHSVAQQLFVSQFQRLEHHGTVGDIINGIGTADLLRQHAAGKTGGQVEIRNQRQKLPAGMQGEVHRHRQAVVYHGGGQAAIEGRCQIVRVSLHGVGDVQQALGAQAIAPQHICTHGTRHQQGSGGAKAPAHRDMRIDMDFHALHRLVEGGQHSAIRGVGHVVRPGKFFVTAGNLQPHLLRLLEGYVGVQAQGAAEGIKARAQICRGGRNADGYSIHFLSFLTAPAHRCSWLLSLSHRCAAPSSP
jgi:hypothetical protein